MTGGSAQVSKPVTSVASLGTQPAAVFGESESLLPLPATGASGDVYSLAIILEGLVLQRKTDSLATGDASITENKALKEKALDDEKKAESARQKAEANNGGFFSDLVKVIKDCSVDIATGRFDKCVEDLNDEMISDPQFWKDLQAAGGEIAKWGAVVGSIAVAAVTCGAGSAGAVAVILAVVGAGLSTAGAVESETHVLEKLGVDPKAAGWIDVGLSCAGAVCSLGAGLASSGATLASVTKTVATVTTVTTAGGAVVDGAGTLGVTHFEGVAKDADGDVKDAQLRQDTVQRFIERTLDQMKDVYESSRAGLQDLASAQRADAEAKLAAVRS